MSEIAFKDISYAQGLWDMDSDPDEAVAMKASGFYTGSKLPYLDDQLVRNYADAIRLGKIPIMYHFAGGGDPATEAAYFIAAVHPLAEGDLYALDWEIEVDDPVGWVNTFVTLVHNATGVWPWVYMDRDRRKRFDWTPVLKNCGLWIAAPDVSFEEQIEGVGIYIAQQGPIVNGVDTDMAFMNKEEMLEYGYHAPTAQPEPTVPTEPTNPVPSDPVEPDPSEPPVEPTPAPTPDPTTTPPPVVTPPVVVTTPVSPISKLEQVLSRAFHTFWQSFVAVFALSITGLTATLLSVHTLSDAKSFAYAAATAVLAAALSAIKNLIVIKETK